MQFECFARRFGLPCAAILVMGFGSLKADAQGFPNRPIRMIYPFSAGSAPDVMGRRIADEAGKILKQPVIFENRTGANGRLGVQAMLDAPADGYLLNVVDDGVVVTQPLQDPKFKFALGKEYTPVTVLFESPTVLISRPGLPFRDFKGLVAYARANPGALNFAETAGGGLDLLTARIKNQLTFQTTAIYFRGGADKLNATLGGHTDLFWSTTSAKANVESGKLIALVSSGKERWRAYPTTPTLAEVGVPISYNVTFPLVVHAGTPREIVLALQSAFDKATRVPEVMQRIGEFGYVGSAAMSPDDTFTFLQSEIKAWAPIIRALGDKASSN